MLFAMSDEVELALIRLAEIIGFAVVTGAITIVTMLVKDRIDQRRAGVVASKVEEVKVDLKKAAEVSQESSDRKEGKIDDLTGAVDKVVKQTNNISAVHLAETLAAYKELLSVKHTPENVARVDKAQEAYDRHVENQARADAPKP